MTDPVQGSGRAAAPSYETSCPTEVTVIDGVKTCSYQFEDIYVEGQVLGLEITGKKSQPRIEPHDVLIYVDASKSMENSPFILLAQIERLIEMHEKQRRPLQILLTYFADGKEILLLPLTEMDAGGKAKLVEAIFSIPFGSNHGGVTIGHAASDAKALATLLPSHHKKTVLFFLNEYGANTTLEEEKKLAELEQSGLHVFVTTEPMELLLSETGSVMTRTEALRKVTSLLKHYAEYKGRADLIKRFESTPTFLMKLALAQALNPQGSDLVDVAWPIFWDPRFHCDGRSACLEGMRLYLRQDREEGESPLLTAEELWQEGDLVYWEGAENYYYFLKHLSQEAKNTELGQKAKTILAFDILRTAFDGERKLPRINGEQMFVGYNLKETMDLFNIDPFTIVLAMLTVNDGELLNSTKIAWGWSREKIQGQVKDHFEKQFATHNGEWRRRQADEVAKALAANLDRHSLSHIGLLALLLDLIPELRQSPLLQAEAGRFIDDMAQLLQKGVTPSIKNNNIYRGLNDMGLVTENQSQRLVNTLIRSVANGADIGIHLPFLDSKPSNVAV